MITQMNNSEEQGTSHMTINTEKTLIDTTAKRTAAAALSVNIIDLTNQVAQAIDITEPRATVQLKRQLRFTNEDAKLIWLQSVRYHDVRISERGKKDEAYQKVLQTFWQSAKDTHKRLTEKSLRDRC